MFLWVKKGANVQKKYLHLLHLLIEFLRHIFTSSAVSIGKTATSESKNVVSKSMKTGKKATKSSHPNHH